MCLAICKIFVLAFRPVYPHATMYQCDDSLLREDSLSCCCTEHDNPVKLVSLERHTMVFIDHVLYYTEITIGLKFI